MAVSLKGSAPATDLFCLSADFGRGGEGNDGGGGAGFLTSPLLFLLLFLRGGALSPETALLLLLRRRWWLLLTMRSSASVLRSSRLDCDLLLDLRSSAGFRSLLQFVKSWVTTSFSLISRHTFLEH